MEGGATRGTTHHGRPDPLKTDLNGGKTTPMANCDFANLAHSCDAGDGLVFCRITVARFSSRPNTLIDPEAGYDRIVI